jgi:hypothetical protein
MQVTLRPTVCRPIRLGADFNFFVRQLLCLLGVGLTYLLRGLSPQANYTDRATAACRRN